ncbi:MAG: hypothetical protein R2751_18990 [Bacteroidales bacterium]
MSISAEEFPDDRIYDVDAAVTLLESGTDGSTPGMVSGFPSRKTIYSYQENTTLTAAIRRTVRPVSGPENQWGLFPSVFRFLGAFG